MELDLADLKREFSLSITPELDVIQCKAVDLAPDLRTTQIQPETQGLRRLFIRFVLRR
jgi:hypothetical protein